MCRSIAQVGYAGHLIFMHATHINSAVRLRWKFSRQRSEYSSRNEQYANKNIVEQYDVRLHTKRTQSSDAESCAVEFANNSERTNA